jgi:hypothetical protein
MTKSVKFYMYKYEFVPYQELASSHSNKNALFEVLNYLINLRREENKALLIDKNENKTEEGPREIFIHNVVYMHKESRIRASMAMLRVGRLPKLKPKDSFNLQSMTALGDVAEETHFYLDYSKMAIFICIEANENGPRMSDIDYYFRKIAKDKLNIAKSTIATAYMNNRLGKAISNLKNVLNFEIKIEPRFIAQVDQAIGDNYFTGLSMLGNKVKPKFLKVSALFQSPGRKLVSSSIENKSANNFVSKVLSHFQSVPENIDNFESFQVKYEGKDGEEETFNLMNDKSNFTIDLDKEIDSYRDMDLYTIIKPKLDDFISNNS